MPKKDSLNAIVLAAGLGTRLRPVTGSIPKPLVPICNRPLLDIVLSKLKGLGVDRIAVNTHYLGETISDFISKSSHAGYVELFHEPEILGTGGPLVNAKKLLSEGGVFLIHNGDVLTDLDIPRLLEFHKSNNFTATFALVDGPENKVRINSRGHIVDILNTMDFADENTKAYTYTGVMALSPEIFKYLPEKPVNYSIIKAVVHAMDAAPGSVGGLVFDNVYWNDLGTIKQFFQAHEDILMKKIFSLPGFTAPDSNILLDENTSVSLDSEINGFLCAGKNCSVGNGAKLTKCVLLDNASVGAGDFRYNEIIAPSFSRHREFQSLKNLKLLADLDLDNAVVSSLVEQGSDRGFFRINTGNTSRVLMRSSQMDEDFDRYISIGIFLNALKLQTPGILSFARSEYSILMEDLGNDIIYKKMLGKENSELFLETYRRIADALALFQTKATLAINADGNTLGVRIFTYDYLRWETTYFMKNFLENFCGLSSLEKELEVEFEALAKDVFAQPKVFMHRDFQSQNILELDDRIRFVDFQGARLGPVGYDIMSLLRDPYLDIPVSRKEELLKFYFSKLLEYGASDACGLKEEDHSAFRRYTVAAGLQRSMQALGAYTFLSMKKGKTFYMKFIPQGYKYLMEGLENFAKADFQFKLESLTELCRSAGKIIEQKFRS